MKSTNRGKGTSSVEVINITGRGITVSLDKEKFFLSYKEFPWFKGVQERHVLNVRCPHTGHLQWPDLDVDLEVDSLISPEKYPLISRVGTSEPGSRPRPPKKGRS